MVPSARTVAIAVNHNVSTLDREAGKSSHAAIVRVLWTVGQDFTYGKVLPIDTTVIAPCVPATSRIGSLLRPMPARVIVNASIGKFRQGRLSRSICRKRRACIPGFTVIITINGIGVVLGPLTAMIFTRIIAGSGEG